MAKPVLKSNSIKENSCCHANESIERNSLMKKGYGAQSMTELLSNHQDEQFSNSVIQMKNQKHNSHAETLIRDHTIIPPIQNLSKCGGLQAGPGFAEIVKLKPVHRSYKLNLVIIHCFLSRQNTFTYNFIYSTVAEKAKHIMDYVDVLSNIDYKYVERFTKY